MTTQSFKLQNCNRNKIKLNLNKKYLLVEIIKKDLDKYDYISKLKSFYKIKIFFKN